ncbi:beta-N-acetylglucosaminidase domain-containing protein [Clostridium sp.]|uniref:beta-N-acetylglucosaminidase domain-containing protein n=1 Tax=Clostridium sp. TaxID=1506 RepID=UPI003F351F79
MIKRKSIFSFIIAGIFTVGMFSNVIVVKAVDKEVKINTISPKPQSLEKIGNGFEIGSKVTLIGTDTADEDAVRELKELLESYGIEYVISDNPDSSLTSIYIGEVDDGDIINNKLSELGVEGAETIENEGYVLAAKDAETNDIVLSGKDERGTYYAVQTLEQLLVKIGEEVSIPEVEIRDYPAMELRGTIEGFYGAPWSHEDRLNQLEFYGENKMNTYIYAPKDDPYHRDKWSEPYPESELNRMQELIDKANEKEVDFNFAISPGNTINLSSEEHYQLLIAKLEQMYNMGVRSFSIFFDDIDNKDALGQSRLLNRVQKEFIEVKEGCKPLVMVPQEYTLGWTGSYTTTMARELDENIIVMWTGNDVVPATITKYDMERAKQKYNRNKMFIWWNFPVNDYCQDKLLMGPTEGLDLELDSLVAGIASNPMNESEASKPTLYTTADYAWNTNNYDKDTSWDNALKAVGGEAYEGLKTFTEHSKSSIINGHKESTEIKPILDELLTKWQTGEDVSVLLDSARDEFKNIENAEADIRENINNDLFIGDIDAYLTKLSMYGRMGQDVINMIDAQIKGDMNEVWKNKLKINKTLKEADDLRVMKWNTSVKVTIGSKVLDPFIRDAIKISDKLFNSSITGEVESGLIKNPITSFSVYQDYVPGKMLDGDLETNFWSARAIEVNDYIGIDFVKPQKITSIYLQMDKTGGDYIGKGQLEYSMDGETWTSIGDVKTESGFKVEGLDIEARYLRYRALEGKNNWLKVYEFDINMESQTTDKEEIYTNATGLDSLEVVKGSGTYSINSNSSILNLKKGDYLGIKLSKYLRFDKFDLDVEGNVKGSIEYSVDGKEWSKLVDVNGSSASIEVPYGAKYIRLVLEEGANGIKINNFKATLETKRTLTASTNLPYYTSQYTINKMVDGRSDTYFWASRSIAKGDYVKVDLGKLTNVRDITLEMAHPDHASDYMEFGQMEYSVDGSTWYPIGGSNSEKTVVKRGLDINARYLRYIAVQNSHNWATFVEFKINTEEATNTNITGDPKAAVGFDLNQIIDKNLLTAYKPEVNPTTGQEIIYKPGSEKSLTGVHIFQESDSICNAEVKVKDKDGNWVSIGRLDEGYKALKVDVALEASDIKLVWDGEGALPIIYEIMPQYTENGEEEIIISKARDLKAVSDKNTINLTWSSPESTKGIEGYLIYKDGKLIDTVGKDVNNYEVNGLMANTIYGFKVVVKYSNNEKSKPVSVNIRTKV